jgi:hypothetical protein
MYASNVAVIYDPFLCQFLKKLTENGEAIQPTPS